MARADLETRVEALEVEVARLKDRVERSGEVDERPWWERIAGTFRNDPMYEEAMKFGREYRESSRPRPAQQRKA
ncbi:hypothetical protein BH23PLA1_BH23PLA1_39080 [soil metagenome]